MPQTPDLFDNAILRDDLPMIKLLLRYNASPSSQTLQTVLRAKRDDILLLLLQAGLSPNQKWSIAKPNLKIIGSVGWWTPLHQVCIRTTWPTFVVAVFLRRRVNPNDSSHHQAVKDGCVPIIELLLEHQADVDAYVYLEQAVPFERKMRCIGVRGRPLEDRKSVV